MKRNIGDRFVTGYLQSWGQTIQSKIDILNEAIKEAGIKAIFVQEEIDGKVVTGWQSEDDDEAQRASALRKALETNWSTGRYETEAARVNSIIAVHKIESYKKNK